MAARDLPLVPKGKSSAFEIHIHKTQEQEAKERANRSDEAIQELVDTELQYNVLLALLLKHYVNPLNDYKTITNDQHNILFPQLQSIKKLSDNFLEDLQHRRVKWDADTTKLSDLFDRFTPYFRMYQDHVNNHEKSIELLNHLKENKKWIAHCQKVEPFCQRIQLSNLLILPTEQLFKYDEILSKILNNTTKNHPDYDSLISSHQAFTQIVEQINYKMIDYDRRENVRKIERKFKDNVKLLEPHRSFLCEGKLWKISGRKAKDRLYQFFLFNDLLIYASSYGQKYKIHNLLPINEKFKVEMFNNNKYGKDKNGRIFAIFSEKKSFVVYADTINLAQEWVKQLKQCETNQNRPERRQSRAARYSIHTEKPHNEQLPIWTPDAHAKECSICIIKFTFTNRRHHCRKCGAVICGKCSKYKIENNEGVKQRACKKCYYAVHSDNDIPNSPNSPNSSTMATMSSSFPTTMSMTMDTMSSNTWMFQLDIGDDSDASDFENEIQILYGLSYYIERTDYKQIFNKFGRGVGSYMLIPAIMDKNDYYTVNLMVFTQNGFESFKISLFEKKECMIFRLEKKSMKKKDFNEMDKLLKYLEGKEKLIFSYPIQRDDVEARIDNIDKNKRKYIIKVEAMYDYESKEDGDLVFEAGDIIYVIDKSEENGWWTGISRDKKGLFPSNYVKLVNEENNLQQQISNDNEEEKVNESVIEKDLGNNVLIINDDEIDDKEEEINENEAVDKFGNDLNAMDGPTRHFYNFLKDVRFEKYFSNFKDYECSDIELIDCFTDIDADNLLKNDVGIKNTAHRKKLVKEFKKLEEKMDAFKESNIIPTVLLQKLSKNGIVTMDILCMEIEKKSDIKNKIGINNKNQCDLLWNIIDIQINPKPDIDDDEAAEGQQPPSIPPVPSDDDDDDDIINNDLYPMPETTKGDKQTPNEEDDDGNDVPAPPPVPHVVGHHVDNI